MYDERGYLSFCDSYCDCRLPCLDRSPSPHDTINLTELPPAINERPLAACGAAVPPVSDNNAIQNCRQPSMNVLVPWCLNLAVMTARTQDRSAPRVSDSPKFQVCGIGKRKTKQDFFHCAKPASSAVGSDGSILSMPTYSTRE